MFAVMDLISSKFILQTINWELVRKFFGNYPIDYPDQAFDVSEEFCRVNKGRYQVVYLD